MTTAAIVGAAAAAVALCALLLVRRAKAQRRTRRERRTAALERLAHSLEELVGELEPIERRDPLPPPARLRAVTAPSDPTTGLPGRAALVDELARRISRAHTAGSRLALALLAIDGGGAALEEAVATVAAAAAVAAPDARAYRSGERQLALVLDDGRAVGIAAVARLEATLDREPRLRSAVVELIKEDDASALLARAVDALTGMTPARTVVTGAT